MSGESQGIRTALGKRYRIQRKCFARRPGDGDQQNERVFAQSLRATAIVMSTPP